MMKEIAPAKLTLTLRMLDKREDGFNELSALTVFLPEISDGLTLNSSGNFEIQSENIAMSPDDSNLVVRAFQLFSSHSKVIDCGVDISNLGFVLEKHIPIAAGLGGGSADAAGTLRILNEKCGFVLNNNELVEIATWLGSDIPGCIYSKALWMEGRGEIVEPINDFDTGDQRVLAITPNIFCLTPLVYKKYEQMGRPTDVGVEVKSFSRYTANLHNDLALAAFEQFPNLVEFKDNIQSITGLKFFLAGSGSTLFTIGDPELISESKRRIENEISLEDIRLLATSSIV